MDVRAFAKDGSEALAMAHLGARLLGRDATSTGIVPGLILGLGWCSPPDRTGNWPVMLVAEGFATDTPSPFEQTLASKETWDLLEGQVPERLLAVSMPLPEPYAGPGDSAVCLGRSGTLGVQVLTAFQTPGILAAGHVAGPVSALVTSGSETVGVVIFSEDPQVTGYLTPTVDVAVIAVQDEKVERGSMPQIAGKAYALPREVVTVYGRQRTSSTIFGFFEWVGIGTGLVRDVWATSTAVSGPGDSGAPVMLADPDVLDAGYVLGHVVGGSPNVTTYIQDLDCQLAATRSLLVVV